jgi:hypothetical protein
MKRENYGDLEILEFEHLNVSHGFTTRRGGVSLAGYESLNLGLNSGDESSAVRENYHRFFEQLQIDKRQIAATNQVHSDYIDRIDRLEDFRVYGGTDGLMTNKKGITLMTYYADCTPLYFYDPVNEVVAVAHAGWKGTERKIGMKMVQQLGSEYGSKPEDLQVGIGPNISLEAYEVDDHFLDRFEDQEYFAPFFKKMPNGRIHFDLVMSNEKILIESGILPEHLQLSGHCTYSESDLFFSYRRQGEKSGRMSGFIRLK